MSAQRIYNQINKYTQFKDFTPIDYDNLIYYIYEYKKYEKENEYFGSIRPIEILKDYLIINNLYFEDNLNKSKKIGDVDIYKVMSKIIGISREIKLKYLDNYENYIQNYQANN